MPGSRCKTCGKAVAEDGPHGLCPECLLRVALASGEGAEATTTSRPRPLVDPSEPELATLSSELAGRYEVLAETGQGGMGKVYLVRDAQLGREVALKQLLLHASPDSEAAALAARARFTREARVTAQLQHPGITPVYELGRRADGSYYYTMKFVHGRTLAAALKDARSLEERLKLLPSFVALCQAIAFAHSRRVIHRDIKPTNVMLGEYGETVIVDWGLAKIKDAVNDVGDEDETRERPSGEGLETMDGTALGTPAYMSPEQAQGMVGALDERSDIYSLGAVLYEILAGRRPFAGASAREVLSQVLTTAARPLRSVDPRIPQAYAAICAEAMAQDPAERIASAATLAERVQDVRLQRPKGWLRRFLERAALAVLVLLPLVVWLLNRRSDAALAEAMVRLSTKGVDLSTGPADFAAGVRRGPERVSGGPTNATGALYALRWEFPELANQNSDWWTTTKKLDVRDAAFPWRVGSAEEAQVRGIVARSGGLIAAAKTIAGLPRTGSRTVIEMAMGEAGNPFETEIPKAAALRGAQMTLAYEAYLAERDGATDRALASTVAALGFAKKLEDLPWLVSLLLRGILTGIALAPVEHMQLAGASDQSLADIETALREGTMAQQLPFATEMEIRGTLYAFELLRNHPVTEIATVLAESPFSLATLGWAAYGRGSLRFWSNGDEVLYLRLMTDALEAARRPYHEAAPDLRRIDRESGAYETWRHPMLKLLLVNVSASAERAATVDSRLALARVRVALERFRKQRRAYPAALNELVPDWLDNMPVDPLSGEPFRYARTEKDYELATAGH